MTNDNKKIKIAAIVGPTACGKTALSVEVAKALDGVAYGGLGHFEHGGNINGTDVAVLLFQNQHSLQIVFR